MAKAVKQGAPGSGGGKTRRAGSAPGFEQLGAAMDALDTPLVVKDAEHRWVYLNDAACTVLGMPREELLGRLDVDYYEPDHARFLWDKDEHVLRTGESISYESRVTWRGRAWNVVTRKSRYQDAQGRPYVVGAIIDVTEIRATEGSLRDSERRLRLILEQASVGVLVIADGKLLFANPCVMALGGYDREDVFAGQLLDFVHPDDRELVTEHHAARMAGREVPTHYLARILTKGGGSRWVGISGVRIEWEGRPASLNFLADVGELRAAQEALARSERQLRQVIDLVPHMIYARDASGRYLLANETMARACGSTVAGLVAPGGGPEPCEAQGWESLSGVDRQVLESGEPVSIASMALTDATGRERVMQCEAVPFAVGGNERAVLGVCTDVTHSSRMRERLQRLNDTLLRFSSEPMENIRGLVALCGRSMGGVCALYSRIEDGVIEIAGTWNAPDDLPLRDLAAGHVCTEIACRGEAEPTCIRNLQETDWAGSDPNVRAYGLRTYVGMPVRVGGSRLGTLCVVHTEDVQPRREDLWLLSVAASAVAVEERRLEAMNGLRRREDTLRAVFDATSDQIMLLGADGTVQAANRHAARRLGLRPEELTGRSVLGLFDATGGGLDEGLLRRVRESGRPAVYSEQRDERYWEHTIYPVFESGGAATGFALFSRETTEEKRVQREILESEERFRATFEQSAVGISHSARDGRLLLVNDKLCDILGYSRQELLAMRFQELTHPDDLQENLRLHHAMLAGSVPTFNLEKRYIRKDGSPVWVNISVSTIRDAAGRHKYNCTVVEDISPRKQIEKALLRRDAVLEAVGFAAEKFLQVADWSQTIHEVLENFGTAAGASRAYIFKNLSDPSGRLCMDHLYEWTSAGVQPEIDNPALRGLPYEELGFELLMATLRERRPFYGRVRDLPESDRAVLEPQGILSLAIVPIFVLGEWWGFIGFDDCRVERQWLPAELEALMAAADILGNAIARRRAEAALLESERKFRIIAETVEDVFWISTPDRRTMIYISPAFERYLGPREYTLRDTRTFYDVVHPDDRERLRAHYRNPGHGALEIEYRLTRRDGALMWIRERAFPVLDDQGNQEWLAGISSDITGSREAEENIRRSLAEKELLLQEVHHRVKNNLQIISSLLDMAGRRIADPKAREIMRDTQSKIHSMAMIHLQLYGYERFDSIDIASYAKLLTWQLAQMYNAGNVTPVFELDETFLPLSKAIPCGLVLSEALSNAFKHAYHGGRAGVLTLRVAHDPDGTVTLDIRDDGPGLPEGFDPDKPRGVGLKLMNNIVRFQLGGTLDMRDDNGTRVRITFKVDDQGAAT